MSRHFRLNDLLKEKPLVPDKDGNYHVRMPMAMSKKDVARIVIQALEDGLSGFTIEANGIRIIFAEGLVQGTMVVE